MPPQKQAILAQTAARVKRVEANFSRGLLTERERYSVVCTLWNEATNLVADAMMANMDEFNPIFMMSDSGARGNKQQMRQLAGMRGLMADPSGKIIDLPITANFREGLSVSDYFISSHGARKGLADTALRTADSGYLTRRLVDVAQDVIVRTADCDIQTVNLLLIRARLAEDTFDALEILNEFLIGRVLAADIFTAEGNVALCADTVLDSDSLIKLGESGASQIELRSGSVNSKSRSQTIILGTSDSTARAQFLAAFIAEFSGKELVTKISDKIASDKIASDDNSQSRNLAISQSDYSQSGNLAISQSDYLQSDNLAISQSDNLILTDDILTQLLADDTVSEIQIRMGQVRGILVEAIRENTVIEPLRERILGRVLAEDIYDGEMLIARVNSTIDDDLADKICAVRTCVKIRSVLTCRATSGVCQKCYGSDLANATEVEVGEAVGIIAAQSIGEPGTQLTMRTFHTGGVAGGDITQGLPRVEELFEARKPKNSALIAEISGVVSFGEPDKNNLKTLIITPEQAPPREYTIPFGAVLHVHEGDYIRAGDTLTDGAKNPHDILRICGIQETHRYLVKEVQKVYKSQGVEINDKHIEVMVRQMVRCCTRSKSKTAAPRNFYRANSSILTSSSRKIPKPLKRTELPPSPNRFCSA